MINRKKILIVEDDPLVVKALKEKFTKENIQVLEATDGETGLKIALTEKPDLILLDLVLSVMDGLTMLQQLRTDSWGAKVPVIILTNLQESKEILAASEAGANSYLVKANWRLTDIVEKIKSFLK
ncbi:MAG: response regulator [Candidatus Paceibacterota bacterium]